MRFCAGRVAKFSLNRWPRGVVHELLEHLARGLELDDELCLLREDDILDEPNLVRRSVGP